MMVPRPYRLEAWSEDWQAMEARLRQVERDLEAAGVAVMRGGPTDRWDLGVRIGAFGRARSLGTIEEHGNGRQMVRWRIWPRPWPGSVAAAAGAAGLGVLAAVDGGLVAAAGMAMIAGSIVVRTVVDLGQGVAALVVATGASPSDR
jgi:hypothetical protein